MILQTCLLLVLTVAWEASGASYSNVFVHTGPEVAPTVEYYGEYPYKLEYASPKIAQYKAPVNYEYPFGSTYNYRTASAVAEPVAAVAAPPSTSVVYPAYTPAVSNLYAGRSEPSGYEYAYVYVPSTGTELRQLNEAEVYRGGYSYLQPELVQYVTDNNQGFNAIFKNYLTGGLVKPSETVYHEKPRECNEGKSGALIEIESQQEPKEEIPEERREGKQQQEAQEESVEHEVQPAEQEGRHAEHEAHEDHDIIIKIQESHDPENDEPTVEIQHHVHAHLDHPEGQDKPKEAEEKPSNESKDAPTHENIVEEPAGPGTAIALAPEYPVAGSNVFISYNDFIKCIKAALARGISYPYYPPPVPKPVSPLTYLIYNKPC